MGLLNPWLLLGLAGVAVPVIIHLLNRFRHREVEWGAMELLRRAIVLRSRQIQIEDILLLVLRCLAVALVALAIARPTITASGTRWLGAGSDVGLIVALDGSYSMDYAPVAGANRRFADAVARCREVLATVEAGTPLTLVVMGDRPRILLRNVGYAPGAVDKLLTDARPLPERLNLERCLREIGGLVDEMKVAHRECYLVSDAQATSWGELSDASRAAMDQIAANASLFFLAVPSGGSENLAVTDFRLVAGQPRQGVMGRFVAELTNAGRLPRRGVPVSLDLNGETVDRRVVEEIPPGATRSVPLFATFRTPGPTRLSVAVGRDGLNVDDVRYAAADVRASIRVLLVDGDPSDRPFASETDYLARALAPNPARAISLRPEQMSWLDLGGVRLDSYDVIVLANVADLRAEQAKSLQSFVRAGGGLIVTLGDRTDPKLLNARLAGEEVSLLPATLGGRAKAPETDDKPGQGWTLAPAGEHPLNAVMGTVPAPLLAEARVGEVFEMTLTSGSRAVLQVAESGAPLLAERSVGLGKVLLLATTADRAWSNLAIHPLFPMLVHEAVGYLAGGARQRAFIVGEPLLAWLPTEERGTGPAGSGQAVFRGPDGKAQAVQLAERDGRHVAEYDEPTAPGIYEVFPSGGEAAPTLLAVNVDRRESEVATLDREALAGSLKGLDVLMPADTQDLAEAIRRERVGRELWRILLTIGLIVLAVEALLAWWFAKRMRTDTAGVSRSREPLSERESDSAAA